MTQMASTGIKKVFLVIGAGAGIGGTVAKRFAQGGYHACLCRRSNRDGLEKMVHSIQEESGEGSASGFIFDATQPGALEDMILKIENEVGQIDVCLYNLGAQIGNRSLDDTTYKQFELGWRLGTFGLFRLSKTILPRMKERGSGVMLVTSSTAAARGNAGQHSHASAMGGRRLLCQTLNAEFGSHGVHVAHIIIDGAVNAPDTLGRMIGQEKLKDLFSKGLLMNPNNIADTYWHLAHQHSSARTFELDLRNCKDVAWWNSRV